MYIESCFVPIFKEALQLKPFENSNIDNFKTSEKQKTIEVCIGKEKINKNRFQVGFYFKGEDHFLDYIFCFEDDIPTAVEWCREAITKLKNL
jgi:hypothetical protein